MKEMIARAGRVLKYRLINRSQRYGVKHVSGWFEAEQITGATVAEVEAKLDEILGPVIQSLSLARIAAGFRLPVNFGDYMKAYLKREYRIIDRATGNPVGEKMILMMRITAGGSENRNPLSKKSIRLVW